MNSPNQTRVDPSLKFWRLHAILVCIITLGYCAHGQNVPLAQSKPGSELEPRAREQIQLLHEQKLSQTPAQRKIGSQLLYELHKRRSGAIGLNALKPNLRFEADGRILVDIKAVVSPSLIAYIKANGGLVVNSFQRYGAIRALVPPEASELLAQRGDVRSIRPAARATTSAGIAYEGGDIAHRAAEARQFFSTDGTGVKVGVLSDSIDGLADALASGALPSVTILPGQSGTGSGEGTAMLEIVHALAPGSPKTSEICRPPDAESLSMTSVTLTNRHSRTARSHRR
jgi:hypothetical protein